MYGLFDLIIFVFAVTSVPTEVDDRVCKVYDGNDYPTCTITFNDDPEAVAKYDAFKDKVYSICQGIEGTSLEFEDDTRIVNSVLPYEVFNPMVVEGNENFINTVCIL